MIWYVNVALKNTTDRFSYGGFVSDWDSRSCPEDGETWTVRTERSCRPLAVSLDLSFLVRGLRSCLSCGFDGR